MYDEDIIPLERIRRYRVQMDRRKTGEVVYKTATFLIEVSTIAAVLGRGLKYIARELGYDSPRRIRLQD